MFSLEVASAESAASTEATTVTTEALTATAALTIVATHLRTEHLQQLLGSEHGRKFCAIFLLDIQTELRLLDLLFLTGEHFLQLSRSLGICQILLLILTCLITVTLCTNGRELIQVVLVDRFELSLLLIGEFHVLD